MKSYRESVDRYSGKGNLVAGGAVLGAVTGGVLGVAFPLYFGWEVGDKIKEVLDFGFIMGTATKMIGSVCLTYFAGPITLPLGIAGGAVAGAGSGVLLEKLVNN
ncbi:MAG: hypothetical protein AABX48_01500 [Nanoarchaeota archaeon]